VGQRGQSTIQFPYRDLESSIAVAKAILDSGSALNGLSSDQLAVRLGINVLPAGGRICTKVGGRGGPSEPQDSGREDNASVILGLPEGFGGSPSSNLRRADAQ
jgi:hypothetical protein